MRTDYKISRLTRHDDGRVEVVARFYEGDVTTANERDDRGVAQPVTRYRRFALLGALSLALPDLPLRATDAQIRRICNDELGKDPARTPIDEQRNAP